jgi:hypothetical protein
MSKTPEWIRSQQAARVAERNAQTTVSDQHKATKPKCRSCGKTSTQHCSECQVCSPRESEHPYWCERASRYGH